MRYYRKVKASPERKAIMKAYKLGRDSTEPAWVCIVVFAAFVGFYAGYILLNS